MHYPKSTASSELEVAKTVSLTKKDIRDAARLFRLLADPAVVGNGLPDWLSTTTPSTTASPGREALISRARIVLNARRLRERHFKRAIFGEPAWEILLFLYIAEQSEGRLTTSRLAEWIATPLTTVLRWIDYLEREQLVARQPHPTDRRIVFIKLTEKGRTAMDSYLGAIPGQD